MASVPHSVLLVALTLSTALAALLLAVTVGSRAVRLTRERRDEERTADPRRRLVAAVAEGDPDDPDLDRLAALDARTWRALEPTVVAMAAKLRGDARGVVIALLERRGAAGAAVRRATRGGAIGRARAADMLGVVGGPSALHTLVRLLDDHRAEVRAVAVRSLGRVGDPGAALALLTGLVGGRHGRLPVHLLSHALVRLGAPAVAPLRAALADDRPDVRATAAELLGLLGAVTAVDDLVDVLHGDEVVEVRTRAARALGVLGSHRAVPALVAALAPDRAPALRATAAEALGQIGSAVATDPLVALVGDPGHWVAHHAAAALTQLGPTGTDALRRLLAGDGATTPAGAHARDALAVARLDDDLPAPVAAG